MLSEESNKREQTSKVAPLFEEDVHYYIITHLKFNTSGKFPHIFLTNKRTDKMEQIVYILQSIRMIGEVLICYAKLFI